LVELLVVIAIIGILATLLLLQLGTARSKARDAKRIADVNQLRSAIEMYYDDNGHYPASTDLTADLVPKYMTLIPMDPLDATAYAYAYQTGTTPYMFQIYANLEQSSQALNSDADIDSSAGGWSGTTIDGSAETCSGSRAVKDCIYDHGTDR